MFNSKLTIQFVPITFVQFAHTRVEAITLQSNACHSTAKCVTYNVLKTYTLTQAK